MNPQVLQVIISVVYLPTWKKSTTLLSILISGKVLLIPGTIKIFEALSSEYAFIRMHRAYLVDERHSKAYDLPNNCVKMSNNMTALVSRRQKDKIEQHILFNSDFPIKYRITINQTVFFVIQLSILRIIPYLCSPKQKSLCGWAVFFKQILKNQTFKATAGNFLGK